MATHSSIRAWRVPGTGEPGGLSSMGSHRVRHDWSDLAAAAAYCLLWLSVDSIMIVTQQLALITFKSTIFNNFLIFFFSFLIFFYCSGFCYTLTWISHRFTCIPHYLLSMVSIICQSRLFIWYTTLAFRSRIMAKQNSVHQNLLLWPSLSELIYSVK